MIILVLLQKSLQYLLSASKCFYRIQWNVIPQEEIELHSWRALVLQKQASTPTVIATWAIQTKIGLKKEFWYLKMERILPTVGKVRTCQVLDFPRPSELHSLFQMFLKYKAALPEIKPPLEENSTETSKISINLTTKQILLNSKGLPRQKVFNTHQ